MQRAASLLASTPLIEASAALAARREAGETLCTNAPVACSCGGREGEQARGVASALLLWRLGRKPCAAAVARSRGQQLSGTANYRSQIDGYLDHTATVVAIVVAVF